MFDKKSRLIITSIFIITLALVGILGSVGIIYGMNALIGDALYASPEVKLAKANRFADQADSTPKGGVLFFGDSIIEMYDLDKHFPDKGYINRGISGNRTAEMLARLDSNVIAVKPSKVIIIGGVNDMGYNVPIDECLTNYSLIIDNISSALPGCEILVQSIYPLRPETTLMGLIGVKARNNDKVVIWNQSIKQLAIDKDCQYIDTYSVLVDSKGKLNREYTVEGLHINNIGYGVISRYLSTYI